LITYALAVPDPVTPSVRSSFVGQLAPNGEMWNDDMFDGAWVYASEIVKQRNRYPNAIFGLEEKFHASSVHKESFGTADAFLYDEASGTLKVWDFKFGYVAVDAYENLQLINYVVGVLDTYNILDTSVNVTLTIIQPRAYHREGIIRSWSVNGADLRKQANLLHNKAHEALGANPMCLTGSHCKYCETRHDCEAALNAGMSLFEVASTPIRTDMKPQEMGTQLDIVNRAIEQLGFLKTAYTERITNELKKGGTVEGYTLSPKLGNKEWVVPIDQVIGLGKMLEIDLEKPQAVITPAQAIKKGMDKATVNSLSERKQGSVELVKKKDSIASRIFGKKGN